MLKDNIIFELNQFCDHLYFLYEGEVKKFY